MFKVKNVLSTSILLETPPHRQAANRYAQGERKTQHTDNKNNY